jgi:diketogulonate reductase-like aldo/keto reductase
MFKNATEGFVLSNGKTLPCIGYGTYLASDADARAGTALALSLGYRHIDTAEVYENEKGVGQGVKDSGIPREQIFITSKVWNTHHGYENTMRAFDSTLKNLGTDYVDLYLIHWPIAKNFKEFYPSVMLDTYRALETIYKSGLAKAIGVSNFLAHHLKTLINNCEIPPMVDQIELHVGYRQEEAVAFCKEHGIVLEAWSPICKGRAFELPTVKRISQKIGKTPAQVLIRWCMQKGYVPLPKSVTPARIAENLDVFDFELSPEDMEELDAIEGVGRLGSHPDSCNF